MYIERHMIINIKMYFIINFYSHIFHLSG